VAGIEFLGAAKLSFRDYGLEPPEGLELLGLSLALILEKR
jgi:hypothetical protein